MKNYAAPRTLAGAHICAAMDPIEYYRRPYSRAWWWTFSVVAVLALVVVFIVR